MIGTVYLLSFLLLPAILAAAVMSVRGPFRLLALLALIPLSLGVYARFVEPHLLFASHHRATICGGGLPGTVKVAVVGDLHQGVFGNTVSIGRIAARLQGLMPDIVLMPGDFTQSPKAEQLAAIFAPLAAVKAPIFAVMGDHDEGLVTGTDLSGPLTAALEAAGVQVLDPGEAIWTGEGKHLRIVGLRDLEAATARDQGLGEIGRAKMATIALVHEPEAILRPDVRGFDLMVAGHTHGGQVLLPKITCALTHACDVIRTGYADNPAGKLFVTSGVGMSALPIRFAQPPRIDVLHLTLDRCRPEIEPIHARIQR